ncbi:uncharacterized protein LOC142906036 isoform X2 [Petromyzon marinus]|uniref:uncharacterized protein LOC142906036 isoform X2 n=1 Tax=Petromyzon marinus TaxID=7757 RepID=UPI003F71DF14
MEPGASLGAAREPPRCASFFTEGACEAPPPQPPYRLEMPANPLDKEEGKRPPLTHNDDCSSSSGGSFSSSSSSFNSYSRSPLARSPGRKSVSTPPLLSDDSDSSSDPTSSAACRRGPNRRAKLETKIPTGTPRDGDEERYSDDFDECLEEARKRLRRLRADSVAHCGERHGGAARGGDSGGSVTDVTPLSSAGSSPRGSRRRHDRRPARQENLNFRVRRREPPSAASEDPATPVGAGKREGGGDDEEFDDLLRSVLSERRGRAPGAAAAAAGAGSRRTSAGRRNFSFNNAECERIERENRRLLRELCRKSPAPGPAGGGAGRGGRDGAGRPSREAALAPVGARPSHSAMNRQREHMRIERANYALLKRLEAAKVSPGLRRAEQLRDHARLTGQALPASSSSSSSSRPASHRAKSQGRASEGSSRASSSFVSRGDRVHGLQPRSLLSSRPAWDPRCAW